MGTGLLATIRDNWAVIAAAPWAFLTVSVLLGVLIWVALGYLKAHQVGDLQSRLSLRDDQIADYKRKLDGASPDEAKARIEALEQAVAILTPKQLTPEQCAGVTTSARRDPGVLSLTYEMGYANGQKLAAQLRRAFEAAGWQVISGVVGGASYLPDEGMSVSLHPLEQRTPAEKALVAALEASGLAYATTPYRPNPFGPDSIQIVLSEPAD